MLSHRPNRKAGFLNFLRVELRAATLLDDHLALPQTARLPGYIRRSVKRWANIVGKGTSKPAWKLMRRFRRFQREGLYDHTERG